MGTVSKMAPSKSLESFFYVLLILKICGLIHFPIEKSTRLSRFINRFYFIIPVSLLTILVASYLYMTLSEIQHPSFGTNNFKVYTFVIRGQTAINFLAAFVSICQAFSSKKQQNFFLKIDQIDELFEKQFTVFGPKSWKICCVSILHVAISFIIFSLRIFYTVESLDIMLYVLYSITILLTRANLVKYCLLVNLLYSRLKVTLDVMENLQRSNRNVNLEEVLTIRKVYNIIWDNVMITNKSMGLTLMFMLIAVFISLIHKTYLMFLAYNVDGTSGILIGKYFSPFNI